VYTPDEKKQLEQLECQATNRHYETAIKQVVGGYVISHKTSYVSDGVILGVTTNQYIASLNGDVREVIAMLYRDDEFQPVPADYVTSPPEECDGPVRAPVPTVYTDFDPKRHTKPAVPVVPVVPEKECY
jgi:hypothetical protein